MEEEKNNSLTNENLQNRSEQKINFEALAVYQTAKNQNPENEIKDVLAQKKMSLETKCHILIDKANAAGGRDNITALLFSTKNNGGNH